MSVQDILDAVSEHVGEPVKADILEEAVHNTFAAYQSYLKCPCSFCKLNFYAVKMEFLATEEESERFSRSRSPSPSLPPTPPPSGGEGAENDSRHGVATDSASAEMDEVAADSSAEADKDSDACDTAPENGDDDIEETVDGGEVMTETVKDVSRDPRMQVN